MIIFLFGQDSYRSRKKLTEIIGQYKKVNKNSLNLRYVDPSTSLRDNLKQSSMFKEKVLSIILNPFDKAFKEKILEEIDYLLKSEDVYLIYSEDKADQRDSLFKLLKLKAKCQEFLLLDGVKLKNWVKKEIERYKGEIAQDALNLLIEYVGNDLWRMENEILKLVNYKENIGVKDVKELVRPKIDLDIFKTIDALGQKDKKLAIKLLQSHMEKGDNPLYLLSMINYQFKNILIVKDLSEKRIAFNAIVKRSGLRSFVAEKSFFQAEKFFLEDLKKIYLKIFQADLDIKTGKVEPDIGLDLLIASI